MESFLLVYSENVHTTPSGHLQLYYHRMCTFISWYRQRLHISIIDEKIGYGFPNINIIEHNYPEEVMEYRITGYLCSPENIAFLLKGRNLKFVQNKTNAIHRNQIE